MSALPAGCIVEECLPGVTYTLLGSPEDFLGGLIPEENRMTEREVLDAVDGWLGLDPKHQVRVSTHLGVPGYRFTTEADDEADRKLGQHWLYGYLCALFTPDGQRRTRL